MPSSTPPIDPRDVAIEERRLSGRSESARVSSSAPGGSRVSDSDSDSDEWSPPEALADAAKVKKYYRPGELEVAEGVWTIEDAVVVRIGAREAL